MRVGVVFPQTEIGADVGAVRAYAQRVEELGYRHVLAYDHVLGADPAVHTGWPGPYDLTTTFHEPFVLFGYLAGVTSLELVTGVIILPQRQTALVAKQAAEVDLLSGGRFRLGVGLGWNAVEYQALGEDFTNRGKRLDEMIVALRALWGGGWVEFHGDYYDVPECQMEPAPTEPVPFICGGHSPVALRRTAELCDGWIAAGAYSEEEAWMHLAELHDALDKAGRDKDGFTVYLSLNERPSVDLYRRFADAGVTDFVCAPWMFADIAPGTPDDKALAARLGPVHWFAEEIVAKV